MHRSEAVVVRGLPVTRPHRTWLDASSSWDDVDVVALIDAMLNRRLVTVTSLSDAVATHATRRGSARARAALRRADAAAESPWETRLRLLLHRAGIPVVSQHVVHDEHGNFVARVDFALPELKIAVEYDGAHHFDPAQVRRDLERVNALVRAGWLVQRYTAIRLLRFPDDLISEVQRLIAARM
jgi:very-short-patch-repair endonuclease